MPQLLYSSKTDSDFKGELIVLLAKTVFDHFKSLDKFFPKCTLADSFRQEPGATELITKCQSGIKLLKQIVNVIFVWKLDSLSVVVITHKGLAPCKAHLSNKPYKALAENNQCLLFFLAAGLVAERCLSTDPSMLVETQWLTAS